MHFRFILATCIFQSVCSVGVSLSRAKHWTGLRVT
jgi:hypothetical protein